MLNPSLEQQNLNMGKIVFSFSSKKTAENLFFFKKSLYLAPFYMDTALAKKFVKIDIPKEAWKEFGITAKR